MTGKEEKGDFWGIGIVLFLDMSACFTHFMKIYQAVPAHVHFPVGMLYLS